MKEAGVFISLILSCVFVSWLIIVKSIFWRKKVAKALGLIAVLGLINGAIFAGLLTLIDLVKYHY